MPLLLLLLAAGPERIPLWVTFDVLNPKTIGGHRILHLEDVIGPRAKTNIPGLQKRRAVLLVATTLDDCGPDRTGLCAELEQLNGIPGGLVIGVVLTRREDALKTKREIPRSEYSIPLTVDTYGVLSQALKLDRPGVCLVVYSNAEVARLVPPTEGSDRTVWARFLTEVKATYLEALRREEER